MSSVTSYLCDNCGREVETGAAHEFAGILQGQATVASGGVHQWHTCSGKCAAEYLRELADKVEARGAELQRDRERAAAGAAQRLALQAALEHAEAKKRAEGS